MIKTLTIFKHNHIVLSYEQPLKLVATTAVFNGC